MERTSSEYSEAIKGLEQFGPVLCAVIEALLGDAGISAHRVTFRIKDFKSASRKISGSQGKFKNIADLTDLLGVRIITYFPHDVDKVFEVLSKEFKVERVSDKRKLLALDRFGYQSLHIDTKLTKPRNHLAEYKQFSKTLFEIQIRSILQHAWAEIEHDLGYKADDTLPEPVQRSFYRLAGLLEFADEEFERIREKLKDYKKHVDETIDTAPQTLMIDQSTIVAALEKEKILIELDEAVAVAGGRLLEDKVSAFYASLEARELKILGINDLDQLLKAAELHKKHVELFAKDWFSNDDDDGLSFEGAPLRRGIGLFYLSYVLAVQKPNLEDSKWGLSLRKDFPEIIKEMRKTWDKVLKELGPPKQ